MAIQSHRTKAPEPLGAPGPARHDVGRGGHAFRGTHPATGKHADHHTSKFRRRFWWCLLLTIPVVATSHMVMDWFGYELDFPGIDWVGPVLGSVIFLWGGWPFLEGGRPTAGDPRPGGPRCSTI